MDIKENIERTAKTGAGTAADASTKIMPTAQRIAILAVGDIIVFLVFAAIGRRSHGEAAGLNALLQIALTAAPFAVAWFVVSPFVGAFRRGLEKQPGKMAQRTALSWLAAWPVAMALRGIFVDHAVPPLTFALITLVTNTILLLIWRWPFSLLSTSLGRKASR
jgi:hypothetical protein